MGEREVNLNATFLGHFKDIFEQNYTESFEKATFKRVFVK